MIPWRHPKIRANGTEREFLAAANNILPRRSLWQSGGRIARSIHRAIGGYGLAGTGYELA